MSVLITGGAGLLGRALIEVAPEAQRAEITWHNDRPERVEGVKQHRCDLTQPLAFFTLAERRRPDLVIHTAYARTDHHATIDMTSEVATACHSLEVPLVHVSSDVVFDGTADFYDETAAPSPLHAYGHAKARCEGIVAENCPDAAIVRTSLIVAPDASDASSSWLVDSLRRGERVTLFGDEYRCPIWATDLARLLWDLVALERSERRGVWHLVGPERLSRVELGVAIAARLGLDASLIDSASSDSMAEPRPKNLTLTSTRAARLPSRPRRVSTVETYGSSK
ncbi:MAG: sugar nucleotide-binding protein [Actinobacteria bacterium]|nr:sugar nucleotide-binding protein [Actinomycetota bacterium]